MTTNTSLHKGRDPRYLTGTAGASGHVGGTRYYTEAAGEPPGQWAGKGAATLGLAGTVDADTMQALYMDDTLPGGQRLDARRKARYRDVREREDLAAAAHRALHPYATEGELEGVRAAERGKSQHATPYFDFTVSAVKSVSVLHASYLVAARQAREHGDHAMADELEAKAADIVAALLAAARAAVAQIERSAYVRTGYHSTNTGEYRDAAGVVAAMFVQHTSREGDPQLHVHIAVLNRAQRADGADGKWRTLHSQMLYQERLSVATHAARELATQLTGLGYQLVPRADENGFEIGGVDADVMESMSSRRAQITPGVARMVEEYGQRYGHEPSPRTVWAMAQDATLKTRKAKGAGGGSHGAGSGEGRARTAGEELDAWEARTTEREVAALSAVHRAVARYRPPDGQTAPMVLDAGTRARIIRIAVARVQQAHAAWTRGALRWEMHRATKAMAAGVDQVALVEELTDEALAPGGPAGVIRLGPAPGLVDVSSLGLRVSDGESVEDPPGRERYTTAAWLDLEEYLVDQARREVPQLVTVAQAAGTLAATNLDEAQREVAAGLLTTRTATSVLVAPAGAGKTHTVTAFAHAWTAWTGRRVIGLTASTNASRVMRGDGLATEGMAEAYNIAQFLGRLEDGGSRGAMRIARDDVLVIDEASQISTTDLAAIQAVATAAGARIVLTGDTAQLGAVEAGGMMRLIAADLGHWELAEVRRFDAEWERLASLQFRRGERAALRAYDARGRIRGGPQPDAEAEAVGLYLADFLMGRDVLLLAGTNEEAARLAGQVRDRLVRLGRVPERPEVVLADGNGAATGDLVRARLNVKIDAAGRPLSNRDTLRLMGWAGQGEARVAIVQRQLSGGGWSRDFPVPADYLRRSTELAYAANVYVAQGRTVDAAHLYVTGTLTRESLYVGMTRGRQANTAHVVTGPAQVRGQEPMVQAPPEAVLEEIMASTSAQLTATETMRAAQAYATSTRQLFPVWAQATRAGTYVAIDARLKAQLSPREYARYEQDVKRPAFQRQVIAATVAGVPLDQVLDVATGRDMRGARSIAGVMHGRVKVAGLGHAQRGQTVTWAQRTPAAARAGVAGHLAAAMDARREELGRQLWERPEPWVIGHLGPPPGPGAASPALIADWRIRAGIAASYRELADITDPEVAIGPAPHDHPERGEAYAATLRALEIRDPDAQLRAMTRGQLEADIATCERIQATAPPLPARELRAVSLAETDARAAATVLHAEGHTDAAQARQRQVGTIRAQATDLEDRMGAYQKWEQYTAPARERAELATAELARRDTAERQAARPHRDPEVAPQATAGGGEPVSVADQMRQDMANVAALEAKLDRQAQAQVRQLGAKPGPEAGASSDSARQPGPLATQMGQNIANLAALEANLDRDARGLEPDAGTGPESEAGPEVAPPDPARQASLDRTQAALDAVAETEAETRGREASRQAETATLEAEATLKAAGPSAWVAGPYTPSWGGPAPDRAEPVPAAETGGPEAGL